MKREDIERATALLASLEKKVDETILRLEFAYYFEYGTLLEQLCDRLEEKQLVYGSGASEELEKLEEIGQKDQLVHTITTLLKMNRYSSFELRT